MKLRQFYNSGFVFYELTDYSLKIRSLKIADWETHEVLLEDILIADTYKLPEKDKYLLMRIIVYTILFWVFLEQVFWHGFSHWIGVSFFVL